MVDRNTKRNIASAFAGVTLLGLITSASGGTFTTALLTGDSDSGISSTKTYTHAVNLGASGNTTVNGVLFSPGGTGLNTTLKYNLDAATLQMNNFTGADGNIAGTSENFFHDFYYNDDSVFLTLDGLTAGQTYQAVFYAVGWGVPGSRYCTVSDGLGGSILYDENLSDDRMGNMLIASYIPTGSSVTFSILQNLTDSNPGVPNTTASNGRYHLYAFSNEVAVPEPGTIALLASCGILFLRRRRA